MLIDLKKFSVLLLIALGTFSMGNATEKFYIDNDELEVTQNAFHIHMGNNIWIETNAIHGDDSGIFTFENSILCSLNSDEYEKKWKCPYCYRYWPIGTACQNAACPSKYK